MNLQTMSIILIIIILPITLILSAYTQTQINTLTEQTLMKTRLRNATYDAVVAFQLNTVHNTYSTVSDSMRRDVNAIIQSFMTNLSGKIGMSGAAQNTIKRYIPAIVFTMYDGYYIYSPAKSEQVEENGESKTVYDHVLKPYIYYTERYVNDSKNIDIVVNYSLDNYIVVTGNVGTEGYVTKSGYLVANRETVDENETITKRLPVTTITFSPKDNPSSIDNAVTFDTELADVIVTNENLKENRLKNGNLLRDTSLFKDPTQLSINYREDLLNSIAVSVLNERIKNGSYSDVSEAELQNIIKAYKEKTGVTDIIRENVGEINLSENLIKYKNALYKSNKYYKPYNMVGGINTPLYVTDKPYNTGFYISPSSDNYYIESTSAKQYYDDALNFTEWVTTYLGDLKGSDAVNQNGVENNFKSNNIFKISKDNDPEKEDSIFNDHKREVIKESIQYNLSQAIESYNQNSEALGTLANFQMPILTETEWDQVLKNVCLITFLQGVQVGTKIFNDYSIVTSTKNKEYVSPESLYFINETNSDGYYHKIGCKHLTQNDTDKIIGYKNSDFDRLDYEKEVVTKTTVDKETGKETREYTDKKFYYYMHQESPCYYCVVNTSEDVEDDWQSKPNRLKAYYTALAREKMKFYKTNSYFGDE